MKKTVYVCIISIIMSLFCPFVSVNAEETAVNENAELLAALGVCGKVDAILLTGGITYSDSIGEEIRRRVSFIAPVIVYPGEDEMQSLAFGCLRVLRGEESARTYTKVE